MDEHSRPLPVFDPDETRGLADAGVSVRQALAGSRCPDPAIVLAVEEGVIDEDVAVRVRAHVATCPACRLAAADLGRVLDEDVSSIARRRIDTRLSAVRARPARRLWLWLIPAGSLVAAAALVIATAGSRPTVPELQGRLTRVTPGTALPTVFVADRPTVVAGEIELTVRGEASTSISLANRIGAALDLADAGDLKTAATKLSEIVRQHPQSHDALLAWGATLLRDGQAPAALTALERARATGGDQTATDEVDWYRAIAFVKSGALDRARAALGPVCDHAGARAPVACAGLAELVRLGTGR